MAFSHSAAARVAACGIGLAVLGTPPVRADVTITSTLTTNAPKQMPGRPNSGGTGTQTTRQTVTAYYKGNKVRTQASGGAVVLYDAATDTTTILNPADKTYTVNASKKRVDQVKPFLSMFKVSVDGGVTPGAATKTIAGLPARNYRVNLQMKMGMSGNAPAGATAGTLFSMKMAGEQWASSAVSLPTRVQTQMATSGLRALGGMMPGMEKMAARMTAIKGLPLSSRMTITMTTPPGMGAAMMGGGGPAAGGKAGPIVITTITDTRSVSRKPLPDSLFTVPAGYREVQPNVPGRGGMPGGRPAM
jgi:hypothetical protein